MDNKEFHIYLVSDSTGETVNSVLKAAMAQFDGISVVEYIYPLVRTKGQIDKLVVLAKENKGMILYTIVEKDLRDYLKSECEKYGIRSFSVIAETVLELSGFFGVATSHQIPGRQHELDREYFSKVEAMNFALSHDDGQAHWDLEEADIVIVGVSRTSKSPTSIYLAYRGFKAANVPLVHGVPIPESLEEIKKPFVVGLTINPERLMQIRKNRLLSLNENEEGSYANMEHILDEINEAKKLFTRKKWPIIDVTRKAVEETAATIIQLYNNRKK